MACFDSCCGAVVPVQVISWDSSSVVSLDDDCSNVSVFEFWTINVSAFY
jgi:hypothetical protein